MPITPAELAAVEGVAAVKAERYGQEFLDIAMKYAYKLSGKQASVQLVRNFVMHVTTEVVGVLICYALHNT